MQHKPLCCNIATLGGYTRSVSLKAAIERIGTKFLSPPVMRAYIAVLQAMASYIIMNVLVDIAIAIAMSIHMLGRSRILRYRVRAMREMKKKKRLEALGAGPVAILSKQFFVTVVLLAIYSL